APLRITAISDSAVAYEGAIGAITGSPSGSLPGSSGFSSSVELGSYSAGSFQRDFTWIWGLANGNSGTGITAVRTTLRQSDVNSSFLVFQCGFSPAIAKDASKTLALTFRYSWGRV